MTHTLRDPSATRIGHIHYAAYTILDNGDVRISLDDTVAVRTLKVVSAVEARKDYSRRLREGWKPFAA